MTRARTLAFIPVFNEEKKIGPILEKSLSLLSSNLVDEIVVVDDGSTDHSRREIEKYPQVTLLTHPHRQGAGDAIRTAYRHALSRGYDVFTLYAGNGKDDPDDVPRMLAPILSGEADYVQGSRFLEGGASDGLPAHRLIAMTLFTWTFCLFLLRRFTDCTNGFRAYRVAILQDDRIQWAQEWLGHSYEIEFYVHYKVNALGYRVCEVPVKKIYAPTADSSYTKVRVRDWLTNLKPLFLLRLGLRR
jgi:dolichol-phosphate mannosyltransferase